MLFNSIEFAIFLPIVFLIYWLILNKSLKSQNLFLLIVSYIFYGWWDWRFLSLIFFSSVVDFWVGLKLETETNVRRRLLLLLTSIIVNLGFLGFFKYFNFFAANFVAAFTLFGKHLTTRSLNIVLPVGISFYTFQTLSYSIDVYRGKMKPTKNIVNFFAFVSFFPQLVAGPIERAKNLLPQFTRSRVFDYDKAVDGVRQILWGLFKKIVIADNAAVFVNEIFNNFSAYSGSTLVIGVIFFAFQIYCDFSGYSDIAIGTARLFGFNLMRNFAFPYFSRDIGEFWRRWHISLSTWFRDYVYIPLGGSRGDTWFKARNIIIIFVVSGFWHGANWTFLAWGLINGLYFLPLMILNKNRQNLDIVAKGKIFPSLRELLQILFTFIITCIAWVFFRADSISSAFQYIGIMLSSSTLSKPIAPPFGVIALTAFMVIIEWLQRDKQHGLEFGTVMPSRFFRWGIYYGIIFAIFWFGGKQQEFIYFQF